MCEKTVGYDRHNYSYISTLYNRNVLYGEIIRLSYYCLRPERNSLDNEFSAVGNESRYRKEEITGLYISRINRQAGYLNISEAARYVDIDIGKQIAQ